MSDTKQPDGIVSLTKPATLDFSNLFDPKAFKGPNGKTNGEPKYNANIMFDLNSDDLKVLKAAAAKVAKAKWPDRELKTLAFPFAVGDKLAEKAKAKGKNGDHQRGKVVLTSRSKYEPRLSVIENGRLVELEGPARVAAKSKFYRGVHVLAQFNFVAYDGVGQNPDGVTAYLNMVCSLNTGERLGGGPSAAEVFSGYVGVVSNEDPTGDTLDDEIPF